MRVFVTMVCALGLTTAAAAPAAAQGWGGTLGGGIALPEDVAKDRLNRGWDLASGSTKKVTRNVAILTELMYNRYGVADSVLRNLHVPEGNARILAGTVNLVLGPGSSGPGFYLVGGGGIYNRKIDFGKPTTADSLVVDSWLGVTSAILVPAGQPITSLSTTKPGVNGGLGFSMGRSSRFYVEARYHWIFTDYVKTTFIPINIGLRW